MKTGQIPRILMISHDASRTGAPLVLLHLADWLVKNAKASPSFLLREDGDLAKEFRNLGPVWIWKGNFVRKGIAGRIIRLLDRLALVRLVREAVMRKRIRPGRFDLVYSNTIANGEILDVLNHPRVITHVHELGHTITNLGQENLEKVIRSTGHYIAVSEGVKKDLEKIGSIPGDKITVIHPFAIPFNSVNSFNIKLREELGISEDAVIIGGSGNTDWRKGADLFVQLASSLTRKIKDTEFYFIWVGQNKSGVEGFYRNLRYEIEKLGMEDRFLYTGLVSNPVNYYEIFDFFFLSSREDPFPLVALENCLLGKPVICFEGTGGIPDLLGNEASVLVPYLDIDTATDRIGELLGNREKMIQIGLNAKNKIRERCDYDKICGAIASLIVS